MDFDRSHIAAGGDFVSHDVALGIHFLAAARGMEAFDGEVLGFADLESPKEGVQVMAGHVADGAGPELAPIPPIEGMEVVMKFAKRSGPDPFIPVQSNRDWLARGPAAAAAEVASQQRVSFGHVADGTRPDI